jgi:hypothetical protein
MNVPFKSPKFSSLHWTAKGEAALLPGIPSTLSPCVLPLIPNFLGAAVSEHRLGPVALATGHAGSFVAIGLFLATIGFSLGIDNDHVGVLAAMILVAVGFAAHSAVVQTQFALVAGPISSWADSRLGHFTTTGLQGRLALGLLLGVISSPSVGTTLGARLGTRLPRGELGGSRHCHGGLWCGRSSLSREAMVLWRGRLVGIGTSGKTVLGSLFVGLGGLTLTGARQAHRNVARRYVARSR